jgi:TRAP-type C4-dicarboxylate transport system permease small subunit
MIHILYSGIDSYTLIHIFKPILAYYTYRYASISIFMYLNVYADTVIHWYIYLALKIHFVLTFFAD